MNGQHTNSGSRPIQIIASLLGIAALYLARDVLVPTALAVLLTFLLSPLVTRLERWRIPRVPAVVITICLTLTFTISIGGLVGRQVVELSRKLPDYRENLLSRVREFRASSDAPFSRLTGAIREIKQELNATAPNDEEAGKTTDASPTSGPSPVAVEVVNNGPDMLGWTSAIAGSLLSNLTQCGITLLLLIFLLLHSEDVRDRLIWLAGMRQISLTTAAMEEVSQRISKYLRTQAIINLVYGTMIAIGLGLFGVPNALLWGVFAGVLRFVPFVGPCIAVTLPTLLTIAAFPGWSRPIGVLVMFGCVELFTNLALEPWLYASSTGISSLGVVCAAVFWAWLWGPVGLILAVPITVCLAVTGRHVPQFALIHYLLWEDLTVPLVGKLYQRLLVADELGVEHMTEEQLKEMPFPQMCDELLLPALQQLKRDHINGLIGAEQVHDALAIVDSTVLIDAVEKVHAEHLTLLCVAAQNETDGAAARLLAHAAANQGIAAEAISSQSLASEAVQRAHESSALCVAIVQVAPISHTHTRHLLKSLANRLGKAVTLVELSFDVNAANSDAKDLKPMSTTDGTAVQARREIAFTPMLARLAELSYAETKSEVQPNAA